MRLLDKLSYSQNWNIGFCELSSDNFLRNKSLRRIQWMKHPFRDRWFADPFILRVTETEIVVFVEECKIEHPKGIICELVLDRATKKLKQRYVLLEKETHLSYPAIIRHNGRIYVYPENGASGMLNIYEYDENNHKLINPICLIDQALADSTILKLNGKYHLIATRFPNTQECVYSFSSEKLFGPYRIDSEIPFQKSRGCSRPAGNWIVLGKQLYRPAQDCVTRYGAGISLMSVNVSDKDIDDIMLFKVLPASCKYSRGIHTINFGDDLCVVDGYGYLHSIAGRVVTLMRKIKYSLKR